jgi:hypothetical protein
MMNAMAGPRISATRERKLKFLKDCGLDLRNGVAEMISLHGADWLTDDQIVDIVRDQIDNWKRSQRMNLENRARAKALADARRRELHERARELSRTMQCNCDLDNWQPEPSTGHSRVCRIHKAAVTP